MNIHMPAIPMRFNPNDLAADDASSGAEGGTEPGTTPETVPMPTYLTPDALLFYCQARLQGLDSQIQQGMQSQQNANYDQQDLQPVQALLAQYADGCKDPSSVQALQAAVQQAMQNIRGRDPSSPAIPALQNMFSAIQSGATLPDQADQAVGQMAQKAGFTITLPDCLSADQIKNLSTDLSQITSTENSGAEINMINLQSLMSQRETAVQLTTNMMQTLDDTVNKVVSNIGH